MIGAALLLLASIVGLVVSLGLLLFPARRKIAKRLVIASLVGLFFGIGWSARENEREAAAQGWESATERRSAGEAGFVEAASWHAHKDAIAAEEATRRADLAAAAAQEVAERQAVADQRAREEAAERAKAEAENAERARVAGEAAAEQARIEAAAKAAEAEQKAAECRADLRCWGDKHAIEAAVRCRRPIEDLARFQVEWTDGWLEPRFARLRWEDEEAGVITFIGDRILFQNAFGAKQPHIYFCTFDTVAERVVEVRAEPGRLPR